MPTTATDFLSLAFGMAILFALMLIGASHLRLRFGRRWIAAISCAGAVIVCGGLAIASVFAAYSAWSLATVLRNPPPAANLKSDWGAEWVPENRTRYSLMLVESTFVNHGVAVEYFDLQGHRVAFVPTEQHRAQRRERLAYIQTVNAQANLIAILGLGAALLPLLALWISRTKIAYRLIELERRLEAWNKAH
jgi:hypothetical protein